MLWVNSVAVQLTPRKVYADQAKEEQTDVPSYFRLSTITTDYKNCPTRQLTNQGATLVQPNLDFRNNKSICIAQRRIDTTPRFIAM